MRADKDTKDFFISYNKADEQFAEWIAWTLNEESYTTIIQAWDFRPGSNFVLEMQNATRICKRTIAVLSPEYLKSNFTQPEWAAAFAQDPTGKDGLLIPIRIKKCNLEGLLPQIVYIDLVDMDEDHARETLINGLKQNRKPSQKPSFPQVSTGKNDEGLWRKPSYPNKFPINNLSFLRNPYFTGRDNEIKKLHEEFISGKYAFQVITGNGGYGKSQIAVEYIYRNSKDYDIVWWINADTEATLIDSLNSFLLGLNILKENIEPEILKHIIRTWMQENERWLFVFDNAKDFKSIKEYLPFQSKGHILITSRYEKWSIKTKPIEIDVLSVEDSRKFLELRTEISNENENAEKLAKRLGGLPLALELAAAYIVNRKKSVGEYISIFDELKEQFLDKEYTEDYPYTIKNAWDITIKEIKSQEAMQLLNLCAFLAPDNIGISMFLRGKDFLPSPLDKKTEKEIYFDDVISELTCYSLVKRNENNSISIHRLLQEVIVKSLSESEQLNMFYDFAVCFIEGIFSFDQNDHTTWDYCFGVLPHVLVLLSNMPNHEGLLVNTDIMNTAAVCLVQVGRYEEAEPLFKRALEISDQISGRGSSDEAILLNNLADLYMKQGKYQEAEKLYKRAVEIREELLGENHPDTANFVSNLALLYFKQGKYEKVEMMYQRALEVREHEFGDNSVITANSYNNLAELYLKQARYKEAEPLYKRALEIRKQQLGDNHPDTATVLNNLAGLYRELREYKDSEMLFKEAIKIDEEVLGDRHPTTLIVQNNLGYLYYLMGNYDEAEILCKKVMELMERVLGDSHPSIATSLTYLGLIYKEQKKYEDAELFLKRALKISTDVLGDKHQDTAVSLDNLAMLYDIQIKFEESEALHKKALEIRMQALGENHPETANSINNLATLYIRQRKYNDAELFCARALEIRKQVLGQRHPDTAFSFCCLAIILQHRGKYEEAESLYKKAYEIIELTFGDNHSFAKAIFNSLAMLYYNSRKYNEFYELIDKLRP